VIVVADAGPLNYLVLIGAVDVLATLYTRVLVPQTVFDELKETEAPADVQTWIAQPPPWLEIRPDPAPDLTLALLDPGERAAIALALSLNVERLLIDDWAGRAEAVRRQLLVTGTLGVLAQAHQQQMLDFETALARLLQTNFYISTELVDFVRRRLSTGEEGA
jgi:predicted nucleic acid-binding protein